MLSRYQVCFYLDNQSLDLEHKLIIKANNSEEARTIAIKECNPTNKGFYTIIKWESTNNPTYRHFVSHKCINAYN